MKLTTIFNLLTVSLALVLGGTACKKNPKGATPIPGLHNNVVGSRPDNMVGPGPIITPNPDGFGIPAAPRGDDFDSRTKNRDIFSANTVHFDVDSAAVKGSEGSNLEAVANFLKSNPAGDLLIEGHCDERGTEGYNLSLGDKRANSLREYLVNLGVSANRIHTVSFGEAQPVANGHDESAWAKNRRGEFIFVEPAK
jgi:peptidoglycan-associated lipoprotein